MYTSLLYLLSSQLLPPLLHTPFIIAACGKGQAFHTRRTNTGLSMVWTRFPGLSVLSFKKSCQRNVAIFCSMKIIQGKDLVNCLGTMPEIYQSSRGAVMWNLKKHKCNRDRPG